MVKATMLIVIAVAGCSANTPPPTAPPPVSNQDDTVAANEPPSRSVPAETSPEALTWLTVTNASDLKPLISRAASENKWVIVHFRVGWHAWTETLERDGLSTASAREALGDYVRLVVDGTQNADYDQTEAMMARLGVSSIPAVVVFTNAAELADSLASKSVAPPLPAALIDDRTRAEEFVAKLPRSGER